MMTHDEWKAEGQRRFGSDRTKWKFVCPSCGHVASAQDWIDAGAPEGQIAFSCIGRALGTKNKIWVKPGPCNYAGGGLFRLNPVDVDGESFFAFAEEAIVQ